MIWPPEIVAICSDPTGEPAALRLTVWLSTSIWELSNPWPILECNPVTFRRERDFGQVQGQVVQVSLDNSAGTFPAYGIFRGLPVVLEIGFADADVWAPLAQGTVSRIVHSADATVTVEFTESVMGLLGATLPRDIRFQGTGWVSGVNVERKSDNSSAYDPTVALVLLTPAAADDETFVVEFTSATAFKVILENGNDTQTGTKAADKTINNAAGDVGVLKIPAAGWDAAAGTYAAGDRFVFYTARARTTAELTPIYMIRHLIADFIGLSVFDVRGGAAYAYPWDDDAAWVARAGAASAHAIAGTFTAGTPISSLIQDALKIVHGSIFPTPTGQLGLWVFEPQVGDALALNGDPDNGPVVIVDGANVDDGLDTAVSEVVVSYLAIGGGKAEYRTVDPTTILPIPRTASINIAWELAGASAKDLGDRYLTRYRSGVKLYTFPATIAALPTQVGGGVVVTDPLLGLEAATNEVWEMTVYPFENRVTVKALSDAIGGAGWFRCNVSTMDGTAVLW